MENILFIIGLIVSVLYLSIDSMINRDKSLDRKEQSIYKNKIKKGEQ